MPSITVTEDEKDVPGKIFIGGLALDVNEKELESHFKKFGRITELLIKRNRGSEVSRGYAFITFENPLDGEDAVKGMNGKVLNGKEIRVDQAAKPSYIIEREWREKNRDFHREVMRPPPKRMSRPLPRGLPVKRTSGMIIRRGVGRGGFDRRGGGRGGFSREIGRSRPAFGKESFRRGSDSSMDRGPPPRSAPSQRGPPPRSTMSQRGPPPRSAPPQRSFDSDRGPPPRRSDGDRFGGGMDRGPPSRVRDRYSPSPPLRDYGGRGPTVDSRMTGRGVSGRDYAPSSRDYAPARDYSPPPSREYQSSRDFGGYESRGPPSRDSYRAPPSRDSYTMSSREYSGAPPSRNNYGGSSHEPVSSRDDYGGGRDSYREPVSRDYQSRDFGGGPPRRDDRVPRDYDTYRDSGRSNGAPPSRSFGGLGSSRDSSGISRQNSRGPYDSPPMTSSRGPSSSSRGPPPSSRGPTQSSRGPPLSSRGLQQSSRGPPPSSRGPMQSSRGPIQSSRGPTASSRGPSQSSRGPAPSSRGPAPSSRGPPRDDRGGGDSRRRPVSDTRGGPPAKRARPGGPPRGGGPPFRR